MTSLPKWEDKANESTRFLKPGIDRHLKKKVKGDRDGNNSADNFRRCSDCCWIIPFVGMIIFMITMDVYGVANSDLPRLIHGVDGSGNMCGYLQNLDKPFLYYCPSTADASTVKVGNLQVVGEDIPPATDDTVETAMNAARIGIPMGLNLTHPVCVASCPQINDPDPCTALPATGTTPAEAGLAYASKQMHGTEFCLPDMDVISALALTFDLPVPDGLRTQVQEVSSGDFTIKLFGQQLILFITPPQFTRAMYYFQSHCHVFVAICAFIICMCWGWFVLHRYNSRLTPFMFRVLVMLGFLGLALFFMIGELLERPPDITAANKPALTPEELADQNATQEKTLTFEEILEEFEDRWDGFGLRKFYEDNNFIYNEGFSLDQAHKFSWILFTISLIFALIGMCWLCAPSCTAYSMSRGMEMLQVANKPLTQSPALWFVVPMFSSILKVIVFVVSLYFFTYLMACGSPTYALYSSSPIAGATMTHAQPSYSWDRLLTFCLLLYIFGMFWLLEFITGVSQFTISYATFRWYYTPLDPEYDEEEKRVNWGVPSDYYGKGCLYYLFCAPCCTSAAFCCAKALLTKCCCCGAGMDDTATDSPFATQWDTVYKGYIYALVYHTGTIAKGSFYVFWFRGLRLVLTTIDWLSMAFKYAGFETCEKITTCCCGWMKQFVVECDSSAYMQVVIDFRPFNESIKKVNDAFKAGDPVVRDLRGACCIFTVSGVLLLAWISYELTRLFYLCFSENAMPRAMATLAAILGGYVAYEFFGLYDVAADTVLHTYLWNKYHSHQSVTRYAPIELQRLMHYRALDDYLPQGITKERPPEKKENFLTTLFPGFGQTAKETERKKDLMKSNLEKEDKEIKDISTYSAEKYRYDLIRDYRGTHWVFSKGDAVVHVEGKKEYAATIDSVRPDRDGKFRIIYKADKPPTWDPTKETWEHAKKLFPQDKKQSERVERRKKVAQWFDSGNAGWKAAHLELRYNLREGAPLELCRGEAPFLKKNGQIPEGDDLIVVDEKRSARMTIREAQHKAMQMPRCRGFTFEGKEPGGAETREIYFSSIHEVNTDTADTWTTFFKPEGEQQIEKLKVEKYLKDNNYESAYIDYVLEKNDEEEELPQDVKETPKKK